VVAGGMLRSHARAMADAKRLTDSNNQYRALFEMTPAMNLVGVSVMVNLVCLMSTKVCWRRWGMPKMS
jgi:hypothetical protein